MIEALAGLDEDEFTWELLGAYEACESLSDHFEEWCAMVGIDPDTTEATNTYRVIHNGYADVWLAMDGEYGAPSRFFPQLEVYVARWRERIRGGSDRTGKRSLVARALHRRTA